jgi:hypothetical protein
MLIDDLEWTLERVQHIARHSVVPEEVEEVFAAVPVFKRGRGGVYEAWGQTAGWRRAKLCDYPSSRKPALRATVFVSLQYSNHSRQRNVRLMMSTEGDHA